MRAAAARRSGRQTQLPDIAVCRCAYGLARGINFRATSGGRTVPSAGAAFADKKQRVSITSVWSSPRCRCLRPVRHICRLAQLRGRRAAGRHCKRRDCDKFFHNFFLPVFMCSPSEGGENIVGKPDGRGVSESYKRMIPHACAMRLPDHNRDRPSRAGTHKKTARGRKYFVHGLRRKKRAAFVWDR